MSNLVTDAEVQEWILNAERKVREDDMHFRYHWARYMAHEQCINSMTEFAANCYAHAIGSMWAMALNPNLAESDK